MLDRITALNGIIKPGRYGNPAMDAEPILIGEIYGRRIYQVTAWPDTLDLVRSGIEERCGCAAPDAMGTVTNGDSISIMLIAPGRYWILAERRLDFKTPHFAPDEASIVDLSASRAILNIQGERTRELLAKGLPVDLHLSVFSVNSIAQSAIAHIPVLVRLLPTLSEDSFEIYIPSGFAKSFWEWLSVAAEEYGYEIA